MGSVETTDYLVQLVKDNPVVAGLLEWPITDVFYGDQEEIARSVTVCVDPGPTVQDIIYGSRKAEYTMSHYIMVYIKTVGSVMQNRRICDIVSQHIMDLVDANPRLGNTVIQSSVTEVRPGYVQRGQSVLRSTRLTINSKFTKILPQSGG